MSTYIWEIINAHHVTSDVFSGFTTLKYKELNANCTRNSSTSASGFCDGKVYDPINGYNQNPYGIISFTNSVFK